MSVFLGELVILSFESGILHPIRLKAPTTHIANENPFMLTPIHHFIFYFQALELDHHSRISPIILPDILKIRH